ncbi:protein Kri1p [Trichomonascus vanleenenianus]|uniref:Kri1p n=1 Tax=Trichomonascus vanleenenianus TaxID=2268995 RepID=UPI003ECB0C02
MARKKSAAKKAREALEKQGQLENVQKIDDPKTLLDESDEEAGDQLVVDESYAKRFQHNKEREELHRLQEKVKRGEIEEEESSSSEEEDDFGELLTEEIDDGINKVLKTIRENPEALLDKSKKFFSEIPKEGEEVAVTSKSKPVYLKDYHRMNLLQGNVGEEDEDEEKPYAVQQEINKAQIKKEVQDAFNAVDEDESDEEEEDGFLKKRKVERTVEPVKLPDPADDEKGFLESFINNQAWIPPNVDKTTGEKVIPAYGDIVDESEDDEEFDDIADTFENAYNFRYEDPNAAQLVSYARDANTLRRQKESSRKRVREKKKDQRMEEENKYKAEVNRVKKLKTKEVLSKLEQLKEIVGERAGEMFSAEDLEGEFDDNEWDRRMKQVFDEQFYAEEDPTVKPTWDDDASDAEIKEDDDDVKVKEEDEEMEDVEVKEEKSKRKQKKEEKQREKLEKQKLRAAAEAFVEKNIDLALEEENIQAPMGGFKFKYREVEADSFGLSPRDILLASDKDLNQYVGLKKLAEFRDAEKKKKDRRKYAKKKRLREWRKEVFKDEEGPSDEAVQKFLAESVEKSKKRKR